MPLQSFFQVLFLTSVGWQGWKERSHCFYWLWKDLVAGSFSYSDSSAHSKSHCHSLWLSHLISGMALEIAHLLLSTDYSCWLCEEFTLVTPVVYRAFLTFCLLIGCSSCVMNRMIVLLFRPQIHLSPEWLTSSLQIWFVRQVTVLRLWRLVYASLTSGTGARLIACLNSTRICGLTTHSYCSSIHRSNLRTQELIAIWSFNLSSPWDVLASNNQILLRDLDYWGL